MNYEHLSHKRISVIPLFYLVHVHILLGIAADGTKLRGKGDVFNIVESGKNRHPGKFCYSGQKGKADVFIVAFDAGIKIPQRVFCFPGHFRGSNVVRDGFVIFINQNNHRSYYIFWSPHESAEQIEEPAQNYYQQRPDVFRFLSLRSLCFVPDTSGYENCLEKMRWRSPERLKV